MSNHDTTLPRWIDVLMEAADGAPLNPLEKFILDYEPAGLSDDEWRAALSRVIEWVKQR